MKEVFNDAVGITCLAVLIDAIYIFHNVPDYDPMTFE